MEKSLLRNIVAVLNSNRLALLKGLIMVVISNCLLIANPLVLRQAVLSLDPTTKSQLSPFFKQFFSYFPSSVWSSALLLLAISLISAYFKYKMRVVFISISRDEEKILRLKLYERIQRQSMEFFNRHGVGELMSRMTNDISAYRDVLGPGVMYPIYFLALIIPGLLALFYLSPILATLSMLPLILIPMLNLAVRKSIYSYAYASKKALGELSNSVQEDYSGIRIIKGYGAEETFIKRFISLCRHFFSVNLRLDILEGLFYPFLTLLTRLITLLLVFSFGLFAYYLYGRYNAADFVSFMWIQSYIFFPVLMMGWVLPLYQQGRAAYDRLLEIYEESVVTHKTREDLKINNQAEIILNHLTFKYPSSSRAILKNISLTIPGGSFVGITGPTGSGKTTLFKLLERAYEIPHGMITIGGHDIHEYPLEVFRSAVVSVEQLPFLFSKTVAENVRFGRSTASQEEIEGVAVQADLHETILSFPKKYETMVGERGITLSGGQKQRVAMSRAFLVNRSILLLDDIFSNVDAKTEKKIFEAILKDFQGKTVLLITHRVSVLEKMQRIIYLKDGEMVEDGSPEYLKSQKGYFATLTELQNA